MASPAKLYQREMHGNLGFFATWFPGDHMELGAVGTIKAGRFRQEATLKDLGIKIRASAEGSPQPLKYTSSKGTSIKTSAGANVPAVTADISVEFSSEGAFIFDALNVRQVRIENRYDVAAAILESYNREEWKKDWYVVESLHKADRATIIVSEENSAAIVLAASSDLPIPSTALADPKVDFSVSSSHGKMFQVINGENLQPLYSCLRLSDGWFTAPNVVPVRGIVNTEASINEFVTPSISELLDS